MQLFLLENLLVNMNIKDRLRQYLDLEDISDYKFQKDIGVTNGYLKKGDTIRSDYLEKILNRYKDLSLLWLLTGEGEMLNTGGSSITSKKSNIESPTYNTSVEVLTKIIDTLSISEKMNTKNIQELIAQGRELTSNITKVVDLLCRNGITLDVISDEEKRGQYSENDTDENTVYTAGSANVG